MKYLVICMIAISCIFSGCAKDTLQGYEPYKVPELEVPQPYVLDTSKLDNAKDEAISNILDGQVFIYYDESTGSITEVSEDEANAVLIKNENFANIADLADITNGYKDITVSQAELLNIERQKTAALIQMIKLQEQSKLIYRDQFIAADKLYKDEHKLRVRERILSDARYIATLIGVIAVSTL